MSTFDIDAYIRNEVFTYTSFYKQTSVYCTFPLKEKTFLTNGKKEKST